MASDRELGVVLLIIFLLIGAMIYLAQKADEPMEGCVEESRTEGKYAYGIGSNGSFMNIYMPDSVTYNCNGTRITK